MSTTTVTVVVAARDAEATLAAAVRSALASSRVSQVVVVDDDSEDGTGGAAASLQAEDPRVEVVARPARGGPSLARNDGLARARGVAVCFLDADDELDDGAIDALAASLASHPDALVAIGRFRAVDTAGGPIDVGRWSSDQLRPVVRRRGRLIESPDGMTPEALVTRLVSPPPGAWLVATGAARAVGGFDPRARRSEDLEFLVRLAAAGPVVCEDRIVLRYLRHPAQRSAAHARRRWGRGHALWRMLRAAPGGRATRALARGMSAYHLELWAARRSSGSAAGRMMAVRNLAVAAVLRVAGLVASVLPRTEPPPLTADAAAVE